MAHPDFAVIGGGIAGVAAAYELAKVARVCLIEREPALGSHATGRSAALWSPAFGSDTVLRLTRASSPFFSDPPDGFADHPLVRPRGTLFVAGMTAADALDRLWEELRRREVPAERLDARSALEVVPALRAEALVGAIHEPETLDIDVDLLLSGYARGLRAHGGEILRGAAVTALSFEHGRWRIELETGSIEAAVIVDAAGAWADRIALLAGAAPLGLIPMRRTAVIFPPVPHADVSRWPAVADATGSFYFKPEAGRLLASPADEIPSEPCDAAADEWDVALTVERVQRYTDLTIPRIEHRFAGLRTFAPDRGPVIGYDPEVRGFFWLAGLGGFGIQTAPAVARAAAALAAGAAWPTDLARLGLAPEDVSPAHLRRA